QARLRWMTGCNNSDNHDAAAVSGGYGNRNEEVVQRFDGRAVGNAVDAAAAKMSLEGFDDDLGRLIKKAGYFNRVAIKRQHGLKRLDLLPAITECQKPTTAHRRRLDVVSHP